MTLEDRLVRVAESILMYAKWFPSFGAFDLSLLQGGNGRAGGGGAASAAAGASEERGGGVDSGRGELKSRPFEQSTC